MVKLANFELLEAKVRGLVERFALLKRERQKIAGVLKKKSQEGREARDRVEKLYRERYLIRSKVDALISKIEAIEHME